MVLSLYKSCDWEDWNPRQESRPSVLNISLISVAISMTLIDYLLISIYILCMLPEYPCLLWLTDSKSRLTTLCFYYGSKCSVLMTRGYWNIMAAGAWIRLHIHSVALKVGCLKTVISCDFKPFCLRCEHDLYLSSTHYYHMTFVESWWFCIDACSIHCDDGRPWRWTCYSCSSQKLENEETHVVKLLYSCTACCIWRGI